MVNSVYNRLKTLGRLLLLLSAWLFLVQRVTADTCDCGVTWLLTPVASVTDTTLTTTANVILTSGSNYIPVVNVQQAQYACYANINCRAVYVYQPPSSPISVAYLVAYPTALGAMLPTSSPSTQAIPTTFDFNRATLYIIYRYEASACTSPVLDVKYYYFTNRVTIESSVYCPFRSSTSGACCWHNSFTSGVCNDPTGTTATITDLTQTWITNAVAHWLAIGYHTRLPPNSACNLAPSPWSGAGCANTANGCFTTTQLPCSGNGVCRVGPDPGGLYSTPNYCSCKQFTIGSDTIDRYKGRACQYDVTLFCTGTQNPTNLCGGHNTRCSTSLVTGTSPNNDYVPACNCDAEPQLDTTGAFCETSRCGPAGCRPGSPSDGTCTRAQDLSWSCVCGNDRTGPNCEYSAVPCQKQIGSPKCQGSGVCLPPFLNPVLYPTSSYPNFQANSSFCACTANLAFGTYCEQFNCDPAYAVQGRGLCTTPTSSANPACLKPYLSSGNPGALKCDIDTCAQFGGVVIGTPASDCNCLQYQHHPTNYPADITCYPRCPSFNGVVCGDASQSTNCIGQSSCPAVNVCSQTTVGSNRYAKCICDSGGYINVNASAAAPNDPTSWSVPPGQKNEYCAFFCAHGTLAGVNGAWANENCNQNCVSGVCSCYCTIGCTNSNLCSCANTGFDTQLSHPRCDRAICQNGGTWDTVAHGCVCNGPYSSSSSCTLDTCDVTATSFVEGSVVANPQTPGTNMCRCNPPYTHTNGTLFNCAANLCGPFGTVQAGITTNTPVNQLCACNTGFTTACYDGTGLNCDYCSVSVCQNGGILSINPVDRTASCICQFPYTGTACTAHQCGLYGSPTSNACICSNGWTGTTCNVSPCVHNGLWDVNRVACNCTSGFTGTDCQFSVSSTGLAAPGSSTASHFSSSSTASTASPRSSSSTGIHVSQGSSSSTGGSASTGASLQAVASASTAISGATIGGIVAASVVGAGIIGAVAWIYIIPKFTTAAVGPAVSSAAAASVPGASAAPAAALSGSPSIAGTSRTASHVNASFADFAARSSVSPPADMRRQYTIVADDQIADSEFQT